MFGTLCASGCPTYTAAPDPYVRDQLPEVFVSERKLRSSMKNYRRLRITAYMFILMALAVSAHASIAGSAWLVPDGTGSNCAQNAVIACVPTGAGSANATFTLADNGLTMGFNTNGTNGTIDQYILSNAAPGLAFANNATTSTLLNVPTSAHATLAHV